MPPAFTSNEFTPGVSGPSKPISPLELMAKGVLLACILRARPTGSREKYWPIPPRTTNLAVPKTSQAKPTRGDTRGLLAGTRLPLEPKASGIFDPPPAHEHGPT